MGTRLAVLGMLLFSIVTSTAMAGSNTVSVTADGDGKNSEKVENAASALVTAQATNTPTPGEEETAGSVDYSWTVGGDLSIIGSSTGQSITVKPNGISAKEYSGTATCTATQHFSKEDGTTSTSSNSGSTVITVKLYKLDTETVATTPTPRTRTKLGVGEQVELTLTPAPTSVIWSITGNGSLGPISTNPTTFTAHERASSPKVSALIDGTLTMDVSFDVVEPSGVIIEQDSGVWHDYGVASVGFKGRPYILPDDVSFMNLYIREDDCVAITTGYFSKYASGLHHDSGNQLKWFSLSSTVVAGKGTKSNRLDTISINCPSTPYWDGTFRWNIPWLFKVGANGLGKEFTIVMQYSTIWASGACEITKGRGSARKELNDPKSSY